MEIAKKDIQCVEIVKKVERLTSKVRKFIRLVNRKLPKGRKLNKEHFIIQRKEASTFLNDGNTTCPGLDYEIVWAYTFADVESNKEDIFQKKQYDTVTFVLRCRERCYDHRKDGLHFFSLYYKGRDSKPDEVAERIDFINDNYDEDRLFCPYELMQIVWRIRNEFYLDPSNILEKPQTFQKFAETFEGEKLDFAKFEPKYGEYNRESGVPEEVLIKINHFEEEANRFATIVNCYCAVTSKKIRKEDMSLFWKTPKGCPTIPLIETIIQFVGEEPFLEPYKFVPKKFIIRKNSHCTTSPSERQISFSLWDCIKSTIGYSYFNKYLSTKGIPENWYPRLLYFNYYISKDLQEEHYTISLTSCEGCFRENYMTIIEANTLEELLTPENAIKIAKWMEEIWRKTALIYYYSSIIEEEKIRNFYSSCEIDK